MYKIKKMGPSISLSWAPLLFTILLTLSLALSSSVFKSYPVTYEDEQIFSLSVNLPNKNAEKRAEDATKLLSHAIEAKDVDVATPLVNIENKKDHLLVYVRGALIANIYDGDAKAEGSLSLLEYADHIEAKLKTLAEKELVRKKWQSIALRFFVSILLLILGFYLLRKLKQAFDRLELILVERQELFKKIKIFGVPLFPHSSIAGFLAFGMEVARWLAYIGSVAIIFFTILTQFDVTRGFLRDLGKSVLMDFANSLKTLTKALPGVALALLILLGLRIAIRAFNLMLDGVKSERVKWASIPIHRVPIFKALVPIVLFAIFLPLAVAAFFQRFDTPTQWLVVGASLIMILGTVPILANWLCGVLIIWRNELNAGMWVLINGHEGEISSIDTMYVHMVPVGGGVIAISMLKVFLSPIRRYASFPKEGLTIAFPNTLDLMSTLDDLKEALGKISDSVEIEPNGLFDEKITCKVTWPISSKEIRSRVVLEVLKQKNIFELR